MAPLVLEQVAALFQGRSWKWPALRRQHLLKEPRCLACGKDEGLNVHHVVPVHVNPDRELDPLNLATLCPRCHLLFGHLDDWLQWNLQVREDVKGIRSRFEEWHTYG